uniref:Polysaccharide biosynthesis domain-containing protein n=1 Tax=Oryza glumipatula TaxID=40148 RepID=A0A0E0BAY6_9ORYZ
MPTAGRSRGGAATAWRTREERARAVVAVRGGVGGRPQCRASSTLRTRALLVGMKSHGSRDKLQAAASSSHRRVLLLLFATCFVLATFLTFVCNTSHFATASGSGSGSGAGVDAGAAASSGGGASSGSASALPLPVFEELVHFASISNATHRMSNTDIRAISAVLRARGPCNLLVFGLGAESPLWLALNHGGRTIFLEVNEFYDFRNLLDAARASRAAECCPIQNLLVSECRLAINDLPNEPYDVAWDIVHIDRPSGWNPTSPGRMPSIFTTAVLARTGATVTKGPTDVLVHDFQFELEQVLSKEFLCDENRVAGSSTPSLGHFVVRPDDRL